jgi:hypothetical protein
MHTQEIHVTGGRAAASDIRSQLFAFPEVLDVLPTSRLDSLVVVIAGRGRPAEWSRHLQAAGYEVLRRPPHPVPSPAKQVLAGDPGHPPGSQAGYAARRRRAGLRRSPTLRRTALPPASATQSLRRAASGASGAD